MKKVTLSKSSRKLLVKMLEDGMKQMPKSPQSKQNLVFMQAMLKKVTSAPKSGEITFNLNESKYLREVMIHTNKHLKAQMASAGFFKKILYRIMMGSYKELVVAFIGKSA